MHTPHQKIAEQTILGASSSASLSLWKFANPNPPLAMCLWKDILKNGSSLLTNLLPVVIGVTSAGKPD